MTYDPVLHHRRSIRLKGHDYAGGGEYFVTICAHRDAGKIFDPPDVQAMIRCIWDELPNRFPEIERASMGRASIKDARTVGAGFMPAAPDSAAPDSAAPDSAAPDSAAPDSAAPDSAAPDSAAPDSAAPDSAAPDSAAPDSAAAIAIMPDHFHGLIPIRAGGHSLGEIIGAFKSLVVHEYISGVKRGDFARFPGKIWQRNYYERIIRNAADRERTACYIRFNPVKLQFRIEGRVAIGNPALWEFPTLGILASGNDLPAERPRLSADTILLSGCHSGMEEALVRESCRPLIWMPAVAPGSIGFADWQLHMLEAGKLLIVCPFEETHTTRENALKRNRIIAERCDRLWIPTVRPGGSLEKLKREFTEKRR